MRQGKYKKYVLLDRDGTIIVDKLYQKDPAFTELLPNAREGLDLLRRSGYGLIVVTNQSGIGRRLLTRADLAAVNRSMVMKLGGDDSYFAGVYYCPHAPEDNCACRKPLTGMVMVAASNLDFSPFDCIVIGDRPADLEMGFALGAVTILVRTGQGVETEKKGLPVDFVADDLLAAAEWILARERAGGEITPSLDWARSQGR